MKLIAVTFLTFFLMEQSMNYFSTPEEAVDSIKKWLIEENWERLGVYYHLDGSGINKDEACSSSFYLNDESNENHHPTDKVKYKRPFDPSYNYNYLEEKEDTVTVWLIKKIDQGNDNIQIGVQFFYLIKKKEGYKILP